MLGVTVSALYSVRATFHFINLSAPKMNNTNTTEPIFLSDTLCNPRVADPDPDPGSGAFLTSGSGIRDG